MEKNVAFSLLYATKELKENHMFDKMLNQTAFDAAYIGVIQQGSLSRLENGQCEYVTKDGRHCAYGHIVRKIRPDLLDQLVEGKSCENQGVARPMELGLDSRLCYAIQEAHDLASCLGQFVINMKRVAAEYELQIPEIKDK